ncbi:hypothetical protein ACFVAJ_17245 [Agromyces sp. NPDC057679]|uniref:hypothetical protein n=1 Tax=Agromyces sp. NPDC057679 TaxID=3346207 RepID=UPI00366F6023
MSADLIYQPGILGDAEFLELEKKVAAQLAQKRLEATAAAAKRRDEDQARREAEVKFHTVTVTTRPEEAGTPDEYRVVDEVAFTCTAPDDAECRSYPECDCESWTWNDDRTGDEWGHPRVPGRQCWLAGWFDAEGAIYAGINGDEMRDDLIPARDFSGPIITTWCHEWVEWEFAAPDTRADTSHE